MCRYSCFADNYRLLSYKYDLNDIDWSTDLHSLMGKVKKKSLLLYPCPPEAMIVKDLCAVRDDSHSNFLSYNAITALIDDICVN